MRKHIRARVAGCRPVAPGIFLLTVDPGPDSQSPSPGQFYMIQSGDTSDPLLKRPFSAFRHNPERLSFLFRVRGRGTTYLSRCVPGQRLTLLGPLGNPFPEPAGSFTVIAGGMGIASVFSLFLLHPGKGSLFFGAATADEIVFREEIMGHATSAHFTTDDGSYGTRGTITHLYASLAGTDPAPVYACGPKPMLQALSGIVTEHGTPCYVSVEEHMACGVGACLGCMIMTDNPEKTQDRHSHNPAPFLYRRVCREGPVFDLRSIRW